MGPSLTAGLRLGAYAFAAGMLLGPVRELLLAPAIGGLAAALVEAVVLIGVLWLLARFVLRPPPGVPWIASLAAVAVVLGAELLLGALFTLLGPEAERAPRDLAEQAVGLIPLAWLAALPFLRRLG